MWAPAVYQFGPTYVLYFAAPHVSGYQCIGAAVSVLPSGPYVSAGLAPIVCQTSIGGSIDPSVFVDGAGVPWMLWKSDGNCCGLSPQIWSAQLNLTGLGLDGAPNVLIGVDQGWEQGSQPFQRVVEGPVMVQSGGTHYLFYSGNWWESGSYAIGYATCASPAGPCSKPQGGPVMASGGLGAGPGGAEFVTDGGGTRWMAYHAWAPGQIGYGSGGSRSLRFSQVTLTGGPPAFGGSPPAAAAPPTLLPIAARGPAPCGDPGAAAPGPPPALGPDKPVVDAGAAPEIDTAGIVPTVIAAGDGGTWVASPGPEGAGGVVGKIDEAAGAVSSVTPVVDRCTVSALTSTVGGAWAGTCDEEAAPDASTGAEVVQLDAGTGAVTRRVPLPERCIAEITIDDGGITATGTALADAPARRYRVDEATGAVADVGPAEPAPPVGTTRESTAPGGIRVSLSTPAGTWFQEASPGSLTITIRGQRAGGDPAEFSFEGVGPDRTGLPFLGRLAVDAGGAWFLYQGRLFRYASA